MLISKIIFIGLPGAGKSSAAAQLAQSHNVSLYSSDVEIKNILNAYKNKTLDPQSNYAKKIRELAAQFEKQGFDAEKIECAFQRQGEEKHSAAFMNRLNEDCWRKVEAAITVLLINEHPDYMFDLGASQVLDDTVQKAIKDNEFHLVYLDADTETIEHHLLTPQIDGSPRWQSISNYKKAGDKWRELALEHRQKRANHYGKIADERILVNKNTTIADITDEIEQFASRLYYSSRY